VKYINTIELIGYNYDMSMKGFGKQEGGRRKECRAEERSDLRRKNEQGVKGKEEGGKNVGRKSVAMSAGRTSKE
jgi:hypothetical protein